MERRRRLPLRCLRAWLLAGLAGCGGGTAGDAADGGDEGDAAPDGEEAEVETEADAGEANKSIPSRLSISQILCTSILMYVRGVI